jgi:virginiamycin B lyase
MRRTKIIFFVLIATLYAITSQAASTPTIRGVVTDSTGKPVRGATVKAMSGKKSVSRFTQNDGSYNISVAPGTYDVSVEAYGFGVKRASVDTAKDEEINFRLSAAPLNVSRLTGSELESLLPDGPEKKLLSANCIACHSFPTVLHGRGSTASEWKGFLPAMTRGAADEPFANSSPATLDAISAALAKYFGPDSAYFGPDAEPPDLSRVKHVDLSAEALRATVVEFDVPTAVSRPHSIEIDTRTNTAWFAEESFFGNKVANFDMDTETFREFPMLTPKARPHTGAVAKDGTYYVALAHANDPAKLASVDGKTGEVKQFYWPEKQKTAAHTLTIDRRGNIWFSGSPAGEIWAFDTETKRFKMYKNPPPQTIPMGSRQDWEQIPGEPKNPPEAATYDVAVDNEDMVWFSEIEIGTLVRLDPSTGETRDYRPEGTVSIRGITVDPQDNLWFGDFHGHRLGKMNVKTGAVKFYKPPTPNATVYGITFNKVDGNVWYADMNGNNITRFDPKGEQFTEFRIPSRPERTYARFIGADGKGRVWFTEYFGDKIGYVDPTGGESSPGLASAR